MGKWNMDLDRRHEMLSDISSKLTFKIKRKLWRTLTLYFQLYYDEDYKYVRNKLYLDLIKDSAWSLNLQYLLRVSGSQMINDFIDKEYRHILELEYKVETLEREKKFYKQLYENSLK